MADTSGMYEFVGIGELAETTTQMLSLNLQQATHSLERKTGGLSHIEHLVLDQARDYLRKVREGFVLSVRTSQVTRYGEIRYLLDRVLMDWDQLSQELGLAEAADDDSESNERDPTAGMADEQRIEHVRHQLLAFGMAAVAMGYLPRLPSKRVTFPHSYGRPPTYSDIPVPHTPGEMLWRIEELEQTVWDMMSRNVVEVVRRRYGPLRRTYGFFEASAYLSRKETERFGVKKRRSRGAPF